MATARITEKDVRLFMMDKPELNPLLRGVRWSPEEIDAALVHTISFFNESPPLIVYYTAENFPYRFTLLIGVAGHLLRSAAINQASNNLTYQVDGVTVNDNDKADIFAKLGQQYWEDFKTQVTNIKVAHNIASAFGSASSELMRVAR
jgi:hypothetical protein